MEKNNQKTNKKKVIIVLLLLFAVIGLAGYGVYSYYWTKGVVTVRGNEMTISSFNPRLNNQFLAQGATTDLSCVDYEGSDLQDTTMFCTGTFTITNQGSTSISLALENVNATGLLTALHMQDPGLYQSGSLYNISYFNIAEDAWQSSIPSEFSDEGYTKYGTGIYMKVPKTTLATGESETIKMFAFIGGTVPVDDNENAVYTDSPITGETGRLNITFDVKATQAH